MRLKTLLSIFTLFLFSGMVVGQVAPDCTSDLIAGQNYNAGTVSVTYDGDSATVIYETTGDWVINETHLWLGDCNALPLNRGGNAAPGRFPYQGVHSAVTSVTYRVYVGQDNCYCVAAHAALKNVSTGKSETGWADGQSLGKNWSTYFQCCRAPDPRILTCTPVGYDNYVQGTTNYGPLTPDRNDPLKAIDNPLIDEDQLNFVALGFGGEITLQWNPPVIATGDALPELIIVETSYTSPDCANYPEYAQIWLSDDNGTTFYFNKVVCQDDNDIDMDLNGLLQVTDVKIIDISLNTNFGSSGDGYDVNGMACINQEQNNGAMVVPNNGPKKSVEYNFVHPEIDPSQVIPDYSHWKNVKNIYPNPAKDQLTIQLSGAPGSDVRVIILNGTGQSVLEYNGVGILDEVVDVSALPNGIYYVHQMIDGQSKLEKIVVQH